MKYRKKRNLLLLVFLVFLMACDKESSTGLENNDDHADWFPPSVNLEIQYKIWDTPSSSYTGTAKVLGLDNTSFPGGTYIKLQIGSFTESVKKGVILWLELSEIDRVGYKAAELYNWTGTPQGNAETKKTASFDWYLREVYDTPLYVEYNGASASSQSDSTTGVFYYGGDLTHSETISVRVEYTFTADVSVTVPYGTVEGCILMHADYAITDSFGTDSFSGQYYLKPDLGVVKATLVPGFYMAELMGSSAQ